MTHIVDLQGVLHCISRKHLDRMTYMAIYSTSAVQLRLVIILLRFGVERSMKHCCGSLRSKLLSRLVLVTFVLLRITQKSPDPFFCVCVDEYELGYASCL